MTLAGADPTRLQTVADKARHWAESIVELGAKNPLLCYRATKSTTLELSQAQPEAVARLMEGRKVTLRELFPDDEPLGDARRRARSLRRGLRTMEEEQGLDVGRLAYGLLDVKTSASSSGSASRQRGLAQLAAPLLLRPATLAPKGSAGEFTVECGPEAELNPVLRYALETLFGFEADDELEERVAKVLVDVTDPATQIDQVYEEIVRSSRDSSLHVELRELCTIGLFSFQKMAMVQDLRDSTHQLANHELVAALADHQPARQEVLSAARPEIDGPDRLPAKDEFLVLDADSSQHRAIQAVLRGEHLVIDGPPGTGKSQTIANLIAELSAAGKKVLFVAEKRAAIEAVTQRLGDAGLERLVLDVHESGATKKAVAAQLGTALEHAVAQASPDAGRRYEHIEARRRALGEYVSALHKPRTPWGITFYEALERLAASPSRSGLPRFAPAYLDRLDPTMREEIHAWLRRFAADDGYGWRWLNNESPWSNVRVCDEASVQQALLELDVLTNETLVDTQAQLAAMLAQVGLRQPTTLGQWRSALGFLGEVTKTLHAFGGSVFCDDLPAWRYAAADRAWRREHRMPIGFWKRRKLLKQLRMLTSTRLDRRALFKGLDVACQQREKWRSLSVDGGPPREPHNLAVVAEKFHRLHDTLAALAAFSGAGDPAEARADQAQLEVGRLNAERGKLPVLPELTELARRFDELGLTAFLRQLAKVHASGDDAVAAFEQAWLTTLVEQLRITDPVLKRFVGDEHRRLLGEFHHAEHDHLAHNAARVRHRVAQRLRKVRDEHREQDDLIRKQAGMKRPTKSLRKLVEEAPDLLLALYPCWAMSPLVVSGSLPATTLFDVVIFDEASQVRPEEAITSIVRGKQLVVAGDDRQLPPTNVFRHVVEEDDRDDDEGDIGDFESVLKVLTPLVRRERLTWHYRSADERLIMFSNAWLYDDELVTFPGRSKQPPVELKLVDGVVQPGQGGVNRAEVDQVVDLVFEHAEKCPNESLGVIAFGAKHRDVIEHELFVRRRQRPDLDEFFADDTSVKRAFFVKNIETVQGDERDAIILTLGYGKSPTGQVRQNFGTLNNEGGERRLNVAVTRARRRLTVVSSFTHQDVNPNSTYEGPRLLRAFLESAAEGGVVGSSRGSRDVELNGFEREVYNALTSAGIPVSRQWGEGSYRIDFALGHPDRPGELVLAVETDGASYHARPSVRDRDRLRQEQLEQIGWKFHRIWSTAWFANQEQETRLMVEAWRKACAESDRPADPVAKARPTSPEGTERTPEARRGQRPPVAAGKAITEYTEDELDRVADWLLEDRLELSRQDRVRQLQRELGFARLGSRIEAALSAAVERCQGRRDKEVRS